MAKKKAARGEVNMAEEIRLAMQVDPALSNKQYEEIVQAKYPGLKINSNSFGVSVTNQRKKLGVKSPRGRKVRRRRPGATGAPRASASPTVSFEHLQAARKFVSEIGNPEVAIAAVRQLAQLQI